MAARPTVSQPAWDTVDLRALDCQAIVMKFFAQAHLVCAILVKGQVNHGSLGTQTAQRALQAGGLAATLENQVNAALAPILVPTILAITPGLNLIFINGAHAQVAHR